jgi:hypothetical protein
MELMVNHTRTANGKPRQMSSFLLGLLILALAPLVTATEVLAVDYYVDRSCANNGNGLADQCASSSGGPGAFNGDIGPQSCLNTATLPGDRCLIKNGTYITTNDRGTNGGNRINGGYYFPASGTAGNPITIRNYPGHTPILAACSYPQSTSVWCRHPTITLNNQQYVTVDGLRVVGAIFFRYSPSSGCGSCRRGIVIQNNDISSGWEDPSDGNWAQIRLEYLTGAIVRNNRIHDSIKINFSGFGGSGIKMFSAINSIIENNTIESNTGCAPCNGIDDKADSINNHHRYNLIKGDHVMKECVRIQNQRGQVGGDSRGTEIYGNVCVDTEGAIEFLGLIDDIKAYNNTIYGWFSGTSSATGDVAAAQTYNNIIVMPTSGGANTRWFGAGIPVLSDYNAFTAGRSYRYASTIYSSLTAVRAGTAIEDHSAEVDCQFVNAAAFDFHLQAGSPCRAGGPNGGRVGGLSSGAPVELGAYGITNCVGACLTSGPPSAPSRPSGLQINRTSRLQAPPRDSIFGPSDTPRFDGSVGEAGFDSVVPIDLPRRRHLPRFGNEGRRSS